MVNDLYGYVREVIQKHLEEKGEFPTMGNIKNRVKEEFGYKISNEEIMDCMDF